MPELIWNGARITITDEQMAELATTGRLTLSDAQLVWRGKDRQDWSDLIVNVPPLYIQEKIHPKAIIDDLKRRTASTREATSATPDLFADFNGIAPDQRAEFYAHDQHWSNRMILGDSLQVMASLAEREALRGKVQCIYFDPPYGIKFNSNWQVSTQSRDVKDGKQTDISREPEQVKAFRDTWKDGIHSYLTYLRDRLTAMRDLLTESGSIFLQISDENVHRVRALLDEVFGPDNFIAQIVFSKTAGATSQFIPGTYDVILFYAKNKTHLKFKLPYKRKVLSGEGGSAYSRVRFADLATRALKSDEKIAPETLPKGSRVYRIDNLTSQSVGRDKGEGAASWFPVDFEGRQLRPSLKVRWKTSEPGMQRLKRSARLEASTNGLYYVRYFDDFAVFAETDVWSDTGIAGFASDKQYVVETSSKVVERCILMATDPGDLVLDPTCGSGTTAFVAEQWGRRWITIDTSRVALALARTRLMAARYPWYLLADSREGRAKEAALTQTVPPETPVHNDIRQGFVYERVPHITLKSIANNPLIDDIWERWQAVLEPLRALINEAGGKAWEEWQLPREWPEDVFDALVKIAPEELGPPAAHVAASDIGWESTNRMKASRVLHWWWEARIARQKEIDASIAARADVEYLYDKPYADNSRVRVAGPFTVESLSPHRVLPASEEELID
ncbi:MAG: site-specific DNA-methyltransferase, partial [Burkholderiales bacterium]